MSASEPITPPVPLAALQLDTEAPSCGGGDAAGAVSGTRTEAGTVTGAAVRVGFPAPGSPQGAPDGSSDFSVPLKLLDGPAAETWWLMGGEADALPKHQGITSVASEGLLACEAFTPDATDPREAGRLLYSRLLKYLEVTGYPHIVKGWNYLADINQGEGDAERYKQFCLGRGEALDAAWTQDYLPAGTGVGAGPDTGLRVTLLASRERPRLVENPRQVSAYRYPRQYGPKSPSFSRAATIGDERRWLFISGTAAIVGHDSLHTSSIEGQVEETLLNWSSLFDAYEALGEKRPTLSERGWYRIYLRHEASLPVAKALLKKAGLPMHRTRFFLADICRRELLFEMDGTIDLGD